MGRSQSGYQYDALRGNEIRLLRMRSSWIPGAVKLDLAHFDLASAPAYIALSYNWGSPQPTYRITVNGAPVQIRGNLWSFLRHARPDPDAPGTVFPGPSDVVDLDRELRHKSLSNNSLGYFWVDALCIDQENVEERNAQVPRMKELYERAAKVVVWLGPEADDSKLAMNTIEALGQAVRGSGNADTDYSELRASVTLRAAKALQSLAQRDWWERAWVVQEASVPHRRESPAAVWCGHQRIPWYCFSLADVAFYEMFVESDAVRYAAVHNPRVFSLEKLKDWRRPQRLDDPTALPATELLSLLSEARISDASDHKDKVYAILALAPEAHHPDLRPDYSKAVSVGEVYRQVAAYIIKRDQNLDVLGHCFRAEHEGASWAPDWSVRVAPTPFPKVHLASEGGISSVYRASGDRKTAIRFSGQGDALTAQGVEVDEIVEVSEPILREEAEDDDLADQRPKLLAWSRFLFPDAKDGRYIGGGTLKDAVAHLLCADVSDTYYKALKRGVGAGHLAANMLARQDLPRFLFSVPGAVHNATRLRCLIRTRKGYLGLASMIAESGDKVCILFGGQVPFVLRARSGAWRFVSEAYVHGIMDGEVLSDATLDVKDFTLV